MLTEKEWEILRYQFVETGYFDFEGRPKTLKALRRVLERLSDKELESLCERVSVIFAPHPAKLGEVYPSTSTPKESGLMVYLSPQLEHRNQGHVDSVTAHELAHVLLHPPEVPHTPSIENEADQKIQLWGFKACYND